MSKEWFIKEGGQVCFKSDNAELNGWDTQSLVNLLNQQNKQITDLEAKLAESEKKFKASKDAIKFQSEEQKEWMDKYFNTAIKLEKLEQQLAEKEKELAKWKDKYEQLDLKTGYYISDLEEEVEEANQDKISFCIEQLEKVKNEITPIFCVPNGIYSNLHNEVFNKIDNQIKQLKGKENE